MDFITAALAEREVDLKFVHQWSCEARRAESLARRHRDIQTYSRTLQLETHDVHVHGAYVRKGAVPSKRARACVRTVARVTTSARSQKIAAKRDFIKNNFDPPKIFQDFGSFWCHVARSHIFRVVVRFSCVSYALLRSRRQDVCTMVATNKDDIDPVDIIIAGRDVRTYVRTRKIWRRHLASLHPPANCHLIVGTYGRTYSCRESMC